MLSATAMSSGDGLGPLKAHPPMPSGALPHYFR
jgi:hypothetical protein